jgi:hypothetical protein
MLSEEELVTKMKLHIHTEVYDDGEWLRPFFESAQARTESLPDDETVERIREQLFRLIAQESIPLVA